MKVTQLNLSSNVINVITNHQISVTYSDITSQNMKVSGSFVINVIIKQLKREACTFILNQYMMGSSSLAINVITKQH